MKKIPKSLLTAAVFLIGVPAAALYGGGRGATSGWYRGPLPASWFSSGYYGAEKCFTSTVEWDVTQGITEVRINPSGVQNDGNPNTFLRCNDYANLNTLTCEVGLPDGNVIACADTSGPKRGPGPNDRVYMVTDEAQPNLGCDIVIATPYGEANPVCRNSVGDTVFTGSGGTGGGSSTSTGGGTSTCNASNATAYLTHGQSTTVPANACVRLKIESTWGTVNPVILPTASSTYPIPYSYSTCASAGTGSLTGSDTLVGNNVHEYLVDNSSASVANYGCDVYVKLNGSSSSSLAFTYWD